MAKKIVFTLSPEMLAVKKQLDSTIKTVLKKYEDGDLKPSDNGNFQSCINYVTTMYQLELEAHQAYNSDPSQNTLDYSNGFVAVVPKSK